MSVDLISAPDFDRVVAEPNCSMTWGQTKRFFFTILFVSAVIALLFAARGLWLILPFAGAEMLALGAALYWVALKLRTREVVRIDSHTVTVERGRKRMALAAEFPRPWVQLEFEEQRHGWRARRLLLRASGKEVELGSFLADTERDEFARLIGQAITRRAAGELNKTYS